MDDFFLTRKERAKLRRFLINYHNCKNEFFAVKLYLF